ncbi:hypothetical protein CY652_22035 [Burkholderia sp. WAC0059]|uniref:periplasmic heavy metal sensor n=1 Tax=Burkholderia sp. WAC0059 TaxID=2066022 RepID=UPI000C7EB78C|nr:periplasmic heavy metal sensor [Burkholderia sp. WAC0059]PLZ00268.1 hypothetical protein CY652_22035 [Burkholderia sp. WAC0059]
MYKRTSRFLAVAAASLALSMGVAHAQTPASDAHAHGGHGPHHGGFMRHLQQLHDQLHLNADEEKLWQTALTTMKQDHEAAHANHQQFRQQFDTLRQQPILDLNALHDARQHLEQQDAQLREQTATAWLAFYNSLNDQQKTTVSTALKARFAKMEQRRERMRQHWQHRHPDHGGASAPAAQ